MKRVLLEGLCVALAGTAVAFVANAVSPRGIILGRDYFHLADTPRTPPPTANQGSPAVNTNSPAETLAESLKAAGLRLVDSNQVSALYRDPRREQDLVVFVDAREEDAYHAGHIPGAYEFYNFHPEKYVATVVPACQMAQEIVVYCNGGSCDESKLSAQTLRDFLSGPSRTNLLVYGGGMTEWTNNGLPVELGERNSGRLLEPEPAPAPH